MTQTTDIQLTATETALYQSGTPEGWTFVRACADLAAARATAERAIVTVWSRLGDVLDTYGPDPV